MINTVYLSLKNFWNEDLINKLVILSFVALVMVGLAFGGYYYWDRYVHLGDRSPLELGVETLEEMVRENPQDPDARIALAQYYFDNGAYNRAIEQVEQVLAAYPENDNALFILGISRVQLGQPEDALAPLEQFVAIRSESPNANFDTVLETALYYMGVSYLNLERTDEAIQSLEDALVIGTSDADAMYMLGLAYARKGEHELAIEQYSNAVRFVPDFTEAYQGMIESYSALGQPDHEAFARGMKAFSLQDYDTARKYLESAVGGLPDFAPVYLGLGLVYEQQGDYPAAQENLERVLALDTNNYMANHALGRIEHLMEEQGNP